MLNFHVLIQLFYHLQLNLVYKKLVILLLLLLLLLMLLWLYACISILFYGALLNHALFDWKEEKEKPECSDT